ncbi:hypothetical protein AAVH_09783 [Aphelenchoides avenae]|nr:hypothetical protein AAVH_09783 [Aphelenchus avenae]
MASGEHSNGSEKKVATVAPMGQDAPRMPSSRRQSVFEHVFLLSTVQEAVPQRDFHDEVRAYLDVKHLIDQSTVLLDVHSRDVEDVVRL